jgi:hypothetical protein
MEHTNPELVGRWAQGERCRRAIVDAAAVLEGRCELLAFKGVHLAQLDDLPRRWSVDADAVVLGASPRDAAALLATNGWRIAPLSTMGTAMALHPRTNIPVDLHRGPLPLGLGAMSAASLHRRATPATGALSGVLLPDPLDAMCIALAHHAKDGFGTTHGHGQAHQDLELLEQRYALRPDNLLARLYEHRLRRIALLSFEALQREQPRWGAWLEHCALGEAERRATRALVDWILSRRPAARYLVPFLVRATADSRRDAVRGVAACSIVFAHDWAQHAWFRWRGHGEV